MDTDRLHEQLQGLLLEHFGEPVHYLCAINDPASQTLHFHTLTSLPPAAVANIAAGIAKAARASIESEDV